MQKGWLPPEPAAPLAESNLLGEENRHLLHLFYDLDKEIFDLCMKKESKDSDHVKYVDVRQEEPNKPSAPPNTSSMHIPASEGWQWGSLEDCMAKQRLPTTVDENINQDELVQTVLTRNMLSMASTGSSDMPSVVMSAGSSSNMPSIVSTGTFQDATRRRVPKMMAAEKDDGWREVKVQYHDKDNTCGDVCEEVRIDRNMSIVSDISSVSDVGKKMRKESREGLLDKHLLQRPKVTTHNVHGLESTGHSKDQRRMHIFDRIKEERKNQDWEDIVGPNWKQT